MRKRAYSGIGIIGAVLLTASAILPAAATTASFSGDGCYGTGVTEATGVTNQLRSKTNAWKDFTATPCNYTFTQGEYRGASSGQWYGPVGLGWGSLGQQVSYLVDNTNGARNVNHNACWAGGPCPGATTPGITSY